MKKLTILTISALAVMAAASAAFSAEAKTEPTSQDVQMKNGSWTELAQLYPVAFVEQNVSEELTPEKLASWWDVFGDPTMTELIMRSLEKNRDLASARASVKEARYQLGISEANLLPWLDANGSWNNARVPSDAGGNGRTTQYIGLGLDATWEIDIFGGQRASVRAQRRTFEAQYAMLYSTWSSLAAEVAMDYISLRTLQEQLDIANYNVGLQEETVGIQQSRVDAGIADELSLRQAQYTLEQTRATIPSIQASIEQTKNALAILVGEIPGTLEEELAEHKPVPQIDSTALIGIPANAIRQRPDIRRAERELAAQIARKKAARADLWPKFYLTGAIGTQAHEGSLFNGPGKMYSFLPQISWPIFHAGAITKNIKVQGARAEQLLAAYEQTVLTAVSEVRDALSDNVQEYERNARLKSGVDAAQSALDLANEKYANGLVDFTNVINAQSALASLSEQYVVSGGQISTNAVRLFKALGGGWKPLDEAERAIAEAAAKKK